MNTDPLYLRALAKVSQSPDPVEEVRDIIEIHAESIDEDDYRELFESPYEDLLFVYGEDQRKLIYTISSGETETDGPMSRFNAYNRLMVLLESLALSGIEPMELSEKDSKVSASDLEDLYSKNDKSSFHRALHVLHYDECAKFFDDSGRKALIEYSLFDDDGEDCRPGVQRYSRIARDVRPLILNRKLRGRVRDRKSGFRDDLF